MCYKAGDSLIYVTFEVKDGVNVLKRHMPVTLDLAIIDEGSETGKEITSKKQETPINNSLAITQYT